MTEDQLIAKKARTINAYFDGACGPVNPGGTLGMGMHIKFPDAEDESWFKGLVAMETNTNNMAEYIALIHILNRLQDITDKRIIIRGDSQLVVRQMNKEWRIKDGMYMPFALGAVVLVDALKVNNHVVIEWIPREQNTTADILSKYGIDSVLFSMLDENV